MTPRTHPPFVAIALLAGILVLAASPRTFAQDTEWSKLNQEVESLFETGNYDKGVEVCKKALELAEKTDGKDRPNYATSLNNLAALYDAKGLHSEAEPMLKRALEIR